MRVMSIHRPKRASSRRSDSSSDTPRAQSGAAAGPTKWKEAVGDKPDSAFLAYATTTTFSRDALILHPKFGKGLVVEIDGNKVHVLFEDGIKKLLHHGQG
jgi:hypothetical protein